MAVGVDESGDHVASSCVDRPLGLHVGAEGGEMPVNHRHGRRKGALVEHVHHLAVRDEKVGFPASFAYVYERRCKLLVHMLYLHGI